MPDSGTEDTQLLPWRQAQQLVGRYVDERTGIEDQQKYTEAFDLYMLSEIQRDKQKRNKLFNLLCGRVLPRFLFQKQ